MRTNILGVSSLCPKAVLFLVLVSNSCLCIVTNFGSPRPAENSSTMSSSDQRSPMFLGNGSVTDVREGELYADFLPPGSSKRYAIVAPKSSLVSFFFQTDTEGAALNVEAEGPVNRTRIDVVWLPPPYVYYVSNRSEVQFLITNPSSDTVRYSFYVDVSQPIGDSSAKILHLEGGKAAFHVDLRKDDRVLLKLSPANHSKMRVWVFALYYDILPETTYKLRIYRQSVHPNLYFAADLAGRYYVVIDSVEGGGEFSLQSSVYPPPWNQEWFWLVVLLPFLLTATSMIDIGAMRRLGKGSLFALISCYSWLGTIGLSFSTVGSFGYGTSVFMPMFYTLILSFVLSHALQIYATRLDRKVTSRKCPNCGKTVNLKEANYCCGRVVRNVSDAWFLLPLSLGFLFFIISYTVLDRISPSLASNSLWAGSCGSIIGGIIARWINRNVYAIKVWKENPRRYYIPGHIRFVPIGLLATGILFSTLSPILVGIVLEAFLTQHVESFLPAHAPWVRVRIAPLTLSLYVILGCAISAILSGLLVAYKIREILARSLSERTEVG